MQLSPSTLKRFRDKIRKTSTCWLWQGACGGKAQHGQVRINYRLYYAHRIAYAIAYGYLPPLVRHSCDTPACVNPLHLLRGTQADNMRDASQRLRMRGQRVCVRGHKCVDRKPCRPCARLRYRKWYYSG